MFNISKKITAAILTLGMLAPQVASANFYVIPVGQTPIPTSSVKNFNSSCIDNSGGATTALPYTVPEGKAFVVKSIAISSCNTVSEVNGFIQVGPNYKQYVKATSAYAENSLYNYNLGIVMQAGEQISLTNTTVSTGRQLMISVSGYETRP